MPLVRSQSFNEFLTLASKIRQKLPQTEGWLELFLTPQEKASFSAWSEVVDNKCACWRAARTGLPA